VTGPNNSVSPSDLAILKYMHTDVQKLTISRLLHIHKLTLLSFQAD